MLARRPFHFSQITNIDPSYVDFNIVFPHARKWCYEWCHISPTTVNLESPQYYNSCVDWIVLYWCELVIHHVFLLKYIIMAATGLREVLDTVYVVRQIYHVSNVRYAAFNALLISRIFYIDLPWIWPSGCASSGSPHLYFCQVPENTTYGKMLLRDVNINFTAMVSQSFLSEFRRQ